MPRKPPITIDGEGFTFSSLRTELREIRIRCRRRLLKGRDYKLARFALSMRRPEIPDTESPRIKILPHPFHKEYCFQYEIAPKKWEPFSLKKATTKSPDALLRQKVNKAFRAEVADQIFAFKMTELKKSKNKSFKALYDADSKNIHCDHVIQMYKLISRFCLENDVEYLDIEVVPHPHFIDSFLFENRVLADDWKSFHRKHAKLRLTTKDENMDRMLNEDRPQWSFDRQFGQAI